MGNGSLAQGLTRHPLHRVATTPGTAHGSCPFSTLANFSLGRLADSFAQLTAAARLARNMNHQQTSEPGMISGVFLPRRNGSKARTAKLLKLFP